MEQEMGALAGRKEGRELRGAKACQQAGWLTTPQEGEAKSFEWQCAQILSKASYSHGVNTLCGHESSKKWLFFHWSCARKLCISRPKYWQGTFPTDTLNYWGSLGGSHLVHECSCENNIIFPYLSLGCTIELNTLKRTDWFPGARWNDWDHV